MRYFAAITICFFAVLVQGCGPSPKLVEAAMTQTQETIGTAIAKTQEAWTPTPRSSYDVTYKVIGSVSQAHIGIGDNWVISSDGNKGFTLEHIPWQRTITAKPGEALSIAAIKDASESGSMECQIWIGNDLKSNMVDESENICQITVFLP